MGRCAMSRNLLMCSGVLVLGSLTHCATRSATEGASTPEDALAGYNAAVHANDAAGVARFMTPARRRELVIDVLSEIVSVLRALNPTAAGPASPIASPDPEHHRAAMDTARQILEPFGLEGVLTRDAKLIEIDPRVREVLERQDMVGLIGALFRGLSLIGSKLFDADPADRAMHDIPLRLTTPIHVNGDVGTASAGDETVRFVRQDGRWYIAYSPVWWLPHMPNGA
jgi:hypothetical protein